MATESIGLLQGAAGFPGARGLPGPPGNNVSCLIPLFFYSYPVDTFTHVY